MTIHPGLRYIGNQAKKKKFDLFRTQIKLIYYQGFLPGVLQSAMIGGLLTDHKKGKYSPGNRSLYRPAMLPAIAKFFHAKMRIYCRFG